MLGPYRNLGVWIKSIEFVTELYRLTSTFPNYEIYGLTSQIRRASVSISSNIAEGYGRSTNKELIHFLYNSMGSVNEVETQLLIARNLGYLDENNYVKLNNMNSEIAKMLYSLINIRQTME